MNCKSCHQPLFTQVPYCPFCGVAVAATAAPALAPVSAVTPPAAASAAPVAAVAPVAPVASVHAAARGAAAAPVPAAKPVSAPVPPQPTAAATAAKPAVKPAASAARPPAASATTANQTGAGSAGAKSGAAGKRKRSWGKIALILIGLLVVLSWFGKSPSKDKLACETALTQGSKLLAAGDLAGASAQSVHANVSCSGAARSKAEDLQAAVLKAENSGSSCSRSLKGIDDQLDNFQLGSARSRLDKLDRRCAADTTAKKLRQRLATALAAASSATDAARRALAQRDANAADKAIDRLAGLNRDSDDLPGLRAALATLQAEQAAARQAPATPPVVTSAPAPTPTPVTVQRQPAAAAVKPEVHNAKAEMAVSFIQDAEAALSQGRFDAARTYLDSARRMDPNSPRLDAMARQIRERERQLMQQETTIR